MIRILLIIFLCICGQSYADQITYPTIWGTNDVVTAVKLNNNNNAVSTVVNGNLDNDNMKSGYSLFRTVSALPAAGTQGRVDFLTTDNSLNLDTGAAWVKTITPSGTAQTGSIAYYNSGWQILNPGSQYYSLVSNGTSSLPSYQPIDLANGITGNLGVSHLNSGTNADSSHYWRGDGTWASITSGNQLFTSSGTFTAPSGVTKVYITAIGGGGGGGGATSGNMGGGGGSGSWVVNYPYTVVAGNSYTVTINSGGSGGSGASNGSDGGTTIFDSLTLNGGSGGINGSSTTANGGAGGVGGDTQSATTANSSNITQGISGNSGSRADAGNQYGGTGGASPFSSTTGNSGRNTTGNSATANTGAGGGGCWSNASSQAGGNGAKGFVLVQY